MDRSDPAAWNFACPDWKERLRAGASLMPDLPLDKAKAGRAVGIFNRLRLPDVADQPPLGEAGSDWQRDLVAALFGSVLPDGRRMVRKPFVLVPKKNSKTTTAAAVMLTALMMDDEPRQTYLLFGPSHSIAELAFETAQGMIAADPVLSDLFHVQGHRKTIQYRRTKSVLQIKTFDTKIATGVKPKGILVDELHELGRVHYAARVMQQLSGGLAARRDGFMVIITTQSDQPPLGVFKQELQLARSIRDGTASEKVAQATLPILYEFPEEVQRGDGSGTFEWEDPALWPMVLPNLGKSCHLDLLQAEGAEKKEAGEEFYRIWASQHLNIEIGMGLHSQRWAGADYWLDNVEDGLSLAELLRRSEVVTVGIDGGGLGDLFGLAVVGRERGGDRWLCWTRAWGLPVVLERHKAVASRLQDFVAQGDLALVDTTQEIVAAVAELLVEIRESGLLPNENAIGVDPSDIGALIDGLNARGFRSHEADPATGRLIRLGQIEPVRQGVALTGAIHTAEFKLHDGLLVHGGSEMMAWCVSNAKAVQKGNAVAIDKEVAGSAKIDPLIALFCAVKLMELGPVAGVVAALTPWDLDPNYSLVAV